MTILLEILAVAAIVFGIAAFVVGRVEGMAVAPPDTGDDNLPAGRLEAHMVDRARFGLAFRGYRMSEVDGVLDRLRDELAVRDRELSDLRGDAEAPELFDEAVDGRSSVAEGQLTLGEQ